MHGVSFFPDRLYRHAAIPVLLALILALLPTTASGSASDWVRNEQGRLRLVAAGETVGASPGMRLGLDFAMAGDWKIYWRSPGEAGYPPSIDWAGSENLAAAGIMWPVPKRFSLFGLQTFGYGKNIILPIRAKAKDPAKPVHLAAKVSYLTCAEICVPREATLSLTLPPGESVPSVHAHRIDRYRARVPGKGAETGLDLRRITLANDGDVPVLEITAQAVPAFDKPDAIIEDAEGYRFGKPEVTLSQQNKQARLRLPAKAAPSAETRLRGQTVTLTVFDGQRGLEREITLGADTLTGNGTAAAAPMNSGGDAGPGRFLGIIAIAILGGLILNLMPCVLPVLSLKLLSVVNKGGKERRHIRAGFLATAAGVLISFLILAAAAIALKSAGVVIGWGMQFQQPLFLVLMTLIVTLFACNLAGLFEIPMPRFAGKLAGRMGGDDSMAGHFATGTLATLLATPCSAPFLGTAIAYAFSRGAWEILTIFAALGLGLALPYLLVAAVPQVAAAMPRPGRWMLHVKRVLALALAGTGVWLLTVLATQRGIDIALAVGALMLTAAAILILRNRITKRWMKPVVPALLCVIVAAAFALPQFLDQTPTTRASAPDRWQSLDTGRIAKLVDADKVVFVDVTADWCITCKFNKTRVIESTRIQRLLASDDVARMRGDWTERDPRIATYLASFDRYGIPFNAVYGPSAPEGIVLSEILSRSGVAEAIEEAR